MSKLLVIDDEARVRKTIRLALERAGHDVVEAENGRAGLQVIRTGEFDLIITDILMPEMEGLETIRALREGGSGINSGIKVLAISGGGRWNNAECLAMAKKFGANDILRKPFSLTELLGKVSQLCGAAVGDTGAAAGGQPIRP